VNSIKRVNVLKVDPSVGVTRDMVEGLASSYGESGHRAPVVLGHPKDNAPAWGWVTACEAEGDNLFCDLDVTPEFHTLLSEGRFRERSVAFYDSQPPVLRHLGFLGATPPKVKGLEPINLSEYDNSTTEYKYLEQSIEPNMEEFLKPVVLFALSEQLPGLTAKSFKTEPVLKGSDTITGVVTLSDNSEYNYTLTKSDHNGWVANTTLSNPEVIELSERVKQLESLLAESANTKLVDSIYDDNKLTEAILPKCDCHKLLAEDTTGVAVKLLQNLPPLVTPDTVGTSQVVDYPSSSSGQFEFAENTLYEVVQAKALALGLDPKNPVHFTQAFQSL
jgi:hypothetical protein